MMSSVFSSFDPTLSLFSFSWFMGFVVVFFLPLIYWVSGIVKNLYLGFGKFIYSESVSLIVVKKGLPKFMLNLMLMLALLNFLALFPFCFSLTSHLLCTFPLAYSMWLGVIIFSIFSSLRGVLSHFVPLGTPLGLLSFMVLIEFVSNLIRPMALMFRLTANMMAGHLLLSLVGGFLIQLGFSVMVLGGFLQMFLIIMELGVSFIQAYVFSTLLMLYISEGDH